MLLRSAQTILFETCIVKTVPVFAAYDMDPPAHLGTAMNSA
jgi:hypothetical protein